MEEKGTLYLVSTPIGNLEDITFRAIKTLQEVDLIAAEDTRHSLKLLNHYEIKKPLISYFEHNKIQRGVELINRLLSGESVALITDAGTPGISDPGEQMVKLAIEENINVTMIPGCTASIMALVLSGLPCKTFCFEGFLSHSKRERRAQLERICYEERTIIFYVSPHNCLDILNEMKNILGDRKVALCRELTKKFEEIIRGQLTEIIEQLKLREKIKGEIVLVIEGSTNTNNNEDKQWHSLSIEEHMEHYLSQNIERKEAMKMVAKDRGLTKREVYSMYMPR